MADSNHLEMLKHLLVTENEMRRLREAGERPQGADWHAVNRSIQGLDRELHLWQEFLVPPRRSRFTRGPEPAAMTDR